jgi:phosphatidylserine/phosphatidylglycerophosphate/cardiolipin synthase-like enzyme
MKNLILALLLVLVFSFYAQSQTLADIELVESIPVETSLDNPDIRNTHEVWLEMVTRARRSLDIEQFYVSNEPGRFFEHVLAAIYAAADRGVKVRLIVDARMYKTYPGSVDSLGRYRNIEVRRIDFGPIGGGIQHAKYFIVDGKELFVGSQNFDWRSLEHIHELGLRINTREIAAAYGEIFELDWKLSALPQGNVKEFAPKPKKAAKPVRLTGPGGEIVDIVPTFSPKGWIADTTNWDERAIVGLINGARKSVTLQFLSYSSRERQGGSYTAIEDAMKNAAQRGVRVRMIVSDWAKGTSAVEGLKSLATVPNIEVAFTSIPEWSGGYVSFARVEHCKVIIADSEKFWLGTSNHSKSYFHTSRNLGVICTGKQLAGILTRIFDKSWNSPYKQLITQDGVYEPRKHGERK